ncbi:TPA: hypothetical protein HA278_08605 [Candidatus Woesearchaeota archaeon]|nr:hypothetical protein [archaeon]HIJ12092.1 hypothetical protein [Candidatus Woesearchaeota archaeon]
MFGKQRRRKRTKEKVEKIMREIGSEMQHTFEEVKSSEVQLLGLLGGISHLGEAGKKFVENPTRETFSEYESTLEMFEQKLQDLSQQEIDIQKLFELLKKNFVITKKMVERIKDDIPLR